MPFGAGFAAANACFKSSRRPFLGNENTFPFLKMLVNAESVESVHTYFPASTGNRSPHACAVPQQNMLRLGKGPHHRANSAFGLFRKRESSSTSRMPRCSYTTLRCFPVRATTTPRSLKVLIARSACGLDSPTTCCRYRVLIIGCAIKLGSTRQTAASERTPRRFERASSNCSHKSSMSFLPLVAANRYRKSRTVDS